MKQITFVVVAALCAASMLWAAAPEDFAMKITPATTVMKFPPATTGGGSVNCRVLLDVGIDDVQGWSFGAIVQPAEGVSMRITAAAVSDNVMHILNGAPAAFKTTTAFLNDGGTAAVDTAPGAALSGIDAYAVTQGVVIDFVQVVNLDTVDDYEILSVTVEVEGTMGDAPAEAGRVAFTGAVGEPPTTTVVVHGGGSIPPAVQAPAVITFEPKICAPAAPFTVAMSGGGGGTDAEVVSIVALNFDADGTQAGAQVQGWSYGICLQDNTKLDVVSATTAGTDSATIKNGAPPDFNTVTLYPGQGVTHGVVIDFTAQVKLAAANDWSDMAVTYKILMSAEGDSTYVVPCDKTLGAPPTANVVVIAGSSIPFQAAAGVSAEDCCNPAICNAAGKFDFLPGKNVIAGSANGDGKLDIADGIYILNYMFRGGPPLPCEKAGDANGDCALDATDAVYIIYYQFLDGPAPVYGTGCVLIRSDTCPALGCEVGECE